MAGEDLLHQGRAGAEHAADEDPPGRVRRRRVRRQRRGKGGDQPVDESLVRGRVVAGVGVAGAGAARLVGGDVGGEGLVVGAGGVERLAEAEAEVGEVGRGSAGAGDGLPQRRDQRVVRDRRSASGRAGATAPAAAPARAPGPARRRGGPRSRSPRCSCRLPRLTQAATKRGIEVAAPLRARARQRRSCASPSARMTARLRCASSGCSTPRASACPYDANAASCSWPSRCCCQARLNHSSGLI